MVIQFDTKFDSFLTHSVRIKRSGGYTINSWGEVIPDTEGIVATTTMRIEPSRSKNLTTMLQGKEVLITHKGFSKSTEDIQVNDIVEVISTGTEYLVVLVNSFYDEATFDHYELFLKEVSSL